MWCGLRARRESPARILGLDFIILIFRAEEVVLNGQPFNQSGLIWQFRFPMSKVLYDAFKFFSVVQFEWLFGKQQSISWQIFIFVSVFKCILFGGYLGLGQTFGMPFILKLLPISLILFSTSTSRGLEFLSRATIPFLRKMLNYFRITPLGLLSGLLHMYGISVLKNTRAKVECLLAQIEFLSHLSRKISWFFKSWFLGRSDLKSKLRLRTVTASQPASQPASQSVSQWVWKSSIKY